MNFDGPILITGGSGFIGRQAITTLAKTGMAVHAISRKISFVPTDLKTIKNLEWHECDIFNKKSLHLLMMKVKPKYLLHLGWTTEHGKFWSSPSNLDWTGVTLDLVRIFVESGGERLVCSGTCAEYEAPDHGLCIEDETPIRPTTLYGVAKNACHQVLRAYSSQVGLSMAWGRVFFLCGPFEDENRLVPSVTRSLLAGRPAHCISGRALRDFMDVRDAGNALSALLLSEFSGAVNIASGRQMYISDIVSNLGSIIGRTDLIRMENRLEHHKEPNVLVADTKRLRDIIGFSSGYSLDASLADCVAYWRKIVLQ